MVKVRPDTVDNTELEVETPEVLITISLISTLVRAVSLLEDVKPIHAVRAEPKREVMREELRVRERLTVVDPTTADTDKVPTSVELMEKEIVTVTSTSLKLLVRA